MDCRGGKPSDGSGNNGRDGIGNETVTLVGGIIKEGEAAIAAVVYVVARKRK